MYVATIEKKHQELLASIRHWQNLKVACEEELVWLKDFTSEQFESLALRQIPYIFLFVAKDNLLFLKDSLLPQKKMPSGLLWSPILRAFPIELPNLNHNFFGIQEQVPLQIVCSEQEVEASVLVTSFNDAKSYILTAPQVRLAPLQWIVVADEIFIFGTPLLPIEGATYWIKDDFLVPSGFNFEFPILSETIQEIVNSDGKSWVIWQEDSSYFKVFKSDLKPLSISSFRLTFSD